LVTVNNIKDLRIPARHDPVSGSRDTRPKKIEEWIETLPLANLGETSRQVYNALLEINALKMPVADRLKVMEMFRPTILYITDSLKKHFVGQQFPLGSKSRKVAELSRAILAEMANGYKITIVEAVSNSARLDNRGLLTALHRAIRYLGLILLRGYQVYEPYPDGIWREIHLLYYYAEQANLADTRVQDHEYTLIDSASVADAYKQIMLLSLACPYRLRQGEVEQVYGALERWASFTELSPAAGQDRPQALFVTHLHGDNPPTYLILHGNQDLNACRLFDAQGLTRVIREEMVQAREQTAGKPPLSGAMSQDIMRRLMLAWGVIPRRRFTRTRKFSNVTVAMRLSAAHHFVSSDSGTGDRSATPMFNRRASFSATSIANDVGRMPDLWELQTTPGYKLSEDEAKQAAEDTAQEEASYDNQTWKMVNVSAGGYCLLWDNQEATNAQVGELICLQERGGESLSSTWGVGVIRWMKTRPGSELELGVQMLAPNAIAVATRTRRADGQFGSYQRSLLLPQIVAIQQPATLLLPAINHHVGNDVLVYSSGKDRLVRLTKLLENTGTFAQFHFAMVEQPDNKPGKKEPDEPRDFDSLWSSI
jgi:hypothetical protein